MFLECFKSLDHTVTESCEAIAMWTSKNAYKLSSQLERSCLKAYTFTWCISEHESEINVNQMTFLVNNHVRIVSILDLQNVADKRVCSERVSKVVHSPFILFLHYATQQNVLTSTRVPEVFPEVVTEITLSIELSRHGLTNVIKTQSIFDELNKTSVMACGDNFVGFEPQFKIFALENLIHERYQLHRELL